MHANVERAIERAAPCSRTTALLTANHLAEGAIYLEKKTVVVAAAAAAMVVAGRGADEGRGSNTAAINIFAG